jgi:SAM-dependent methyltransferase
MIADAPAFAAKCRAAVCRLCDHSGLEPILDMGPMPLSGGFLTRERLASPEALYPLEVGFCSDCSLVQLLSAVQPETLFCDDYPYYSSYTDSLVAHARASVDELIATRGLGPESFVVELASNDGYLLKRFVERGVPVLGIDPAAGPASAAGKAGVPTLNTFFTEALGQSLAAEGRVADVIIANNVLAHVPDLRGFVRGIARLLKPNGVAVFEVPYVRRLVDGGEFDTIYHEHLCYFSVTALHRLFGACGLQLNDVRELSIHGGSLRAYVSRDAPIGQSVMRLLSEETSHGLDRPVYYERFAERVASIRSNLLRELKALKALDKTIAAYGAAAKGTILLNTLGVDTHLIEFAVDRNVHKQGKFIPGVRIPILDVCELERRMTDYTVILAWNIAQEVLSQQSEYRRRGGRFIIPIPDYCVV